MSKLGKIERFFLSRRLAVVLLAVMVIPLAIATPARRITDVTQSPYFLVLPVFTFLSVLVCTLDRLRNRRVKAPHEEAFIVSKPVFALTTPPDLPFSKGEGLKEIADYLEKKGWGLQKEGEIGDLTVKDNAVFSRGGSGFWGSMIFHAGLLTLLISAMVTSATLFSAELLIIEGLPVAIGKESLFAVRREPLIPLVYPAGTLTMEKFEAVFKDQRFPVDYVANLKITDKRGERQVAVRVNDPLILGGLQYTMARYGFAPGFKIEDIASGKALFDGYVSLLPTSDGEDFFAIPETGMTLHVRFFPDFEMTEKGPASKSRMPNNPVFGLRLLDSKGREVERGKLVGLGKTAYTAGLAIKAYDLKYWAHFGVIRDYGQPVIAISIILMVAGLVVRFVYHEKWLMVTRRGDGIEVAGYSRYFPALFEEEVERIADEIGRKSKS